MIHCCLFEPRRPTYSLTRSVGLAIDAALFDDVAGDDVRPAGLRYGLAASAASASTDPDQAMIDDLSALAGAVSAIGGPILKDKLFIFGNPKGGTPVMLAAPSSAIDLPLKILVWEDNQGKVWITYNSPSYLQERHNIPPDLLPNIAVIETLATKAAE